jgi:hypothetical protein
MNNQLGLGQMMPGEGSIGFIGGNPETGTVTAGKIEKQGISLKEIVMALMSGVSPEELIKAGVPPELIDQAIQMLESQAQQQHAPTGGGLSHLGMQ